MVLLVLETHGALHFCGGINELAQRVQRHRVVVTTGAHKLELARLVVLLLGIATGKKEALNFSGGVERVLLGAVKLVGVGLQNTAHVA